MIKKIITYNYPSRTRLFYSLLVVIVVISFKNKGTAVFTYKEVFSELQHSEIHQNQFLVNIPYLVTVTTGKNPVIIKVAPMPGAPPHISRVGGNWGTYTIDINSSWLKSCGGAKATVHAEGTERRTKLISPEGVVNIITYSDPALKTGTAFGAGFIIKSNVPIYNRYILDGTVDAYIETRETSGMHRINLVSTVTSR